MFTIENAREAVDFAYNGKSYSMTRDELEAAYRFKEREYRKLDAERAVDYYVFGDDDIDNMDDAERSEIENDFERDRGISYAALKNAADDLIDIFFQKQDCNEAENVTWENAIDAYLMGVCV